MTEIPLDAEPRLVTGRSYLKQLGQIGGGVSNP
jgi:hypothetical protein